MRKLIASLLIAFCLTSPLVVSSALASSVQFHQPTIGHQNVTDLEQSDAGFLEGGAIQQWYCKHQDGSFWTLTPLTTDDATYQDAVNWCAANGYSW